MDGSTYKIKIIDSLASYHEIFENGGGENG
jgi:hypothetical protein